MLSLLLSLLIGSSPAALGQHDSAAQADFSVLHVSDIHVDAHLARSGAPGPVRGAETIRWICEQATRPQELTPFGLTAPPPAFAIATGDLTEYGVIDDTWQVFENAFRDLPCPLHAVPGNHDNTWVAIYDVLRKRHGGENHSFDNAGCHFICICSASPQEPVPTVDAKTRAWLKADLERTPPDTPVFVALHHPPYGDEFANPAEVDTLVDLLRDHNVVLLLYGHGHGVNTRNIGGITGVMGGSTFGKNAGYGLLSVRDGVLRYAYRYHRGTPEGDQKGPAWKPLLDFALPRGPKPRPLDIRQPEQDAVVVDRAAGLAIELAASGAAGDLRRTTVEIQIDGETRHSVEGIPGISSVMLDVAQLTAGAHLLSVHTKLPDGASDVRTRFFHVQDPETEVLWRRQLSAAVKARPVIAGELLVVARTDGLVVALDKRTGAERWTFATGGEILGTPAWSSDTLVFGSGDGRVYALDRHGKQHWAFSAGLPVYGWPLIDDDTVFIGDNGGRMHALDLKTGKPRWTFERADFSIESKPALWNDMVVFGAWDGYLYAVGRDDGTLRWKVWGPTSSEERAPRYYGPADCGPVVIGEKLFVCDRGYQIGAYSMSGELGSKWPAKASAISLAEDGGAFYARTTDDRVCKFDGQGKLLWKAETPAGRFPIPPTACAGKVCVCSNRGRLSVLDGSNGRLLWTYQATPGFYVMAPVAVDFAGAGGAQPVCYVAGMDGSLIAVRQSASAQVPGMR